MWKAHSERKQIEERGHARKRTLWSGVGGGVACSRGGALPRKSLCTTFMKNWLPPELGWPVLAIESVPGSLENLAANSSLMLPPFERVHVSPVFRFL